MAKKYFLYTRISNDDYYKSIDNQKDILEKMAKDKKIFSDVIKPYYEEHKGWSTAGDRPMFKDMIWKLEADMKEAGKNVDKRKYWWILFFKIDRLARNDKDFERLLKLLDAWYEFISATETIENTPTGRLLFRMLSSFAVYESEKLSNRQSIAKIHNLISQKFSSIWWDMIIFWYELVDKAVKINATQSKIILSIYDLFIESNGKMKYKDIFSQLDEKYWWELTKYLKTKWKTTPEKFIRNILRNQTAFKYNWYIEINIGVNDELISNYVKTVTEKQNDTYWFSIEWDAKIWGKVKFVHFLDDRMIVPDAIYEEVVSILRPREFERNVVDRKRTLFEDILYIKHNSELYQVRWKADVKKEKYNFYKKKIGDVRFDISEHKIDQQISKSPIISKMIRGIEPNLVEIKKWLLDKNKVNIGKELKKLDATLKIYNWAKESYLWLLESKDDKIEANTKNFKKYSDLAKITSDEINALEQNSIYMIDKYLEIMKVRDFPNQTTRIKRLVYISLLDKVVFDKKLDNGKYKLILYPFSFVCKLLWLPKEIVI